MFPRSGRLFPWICDHKITALHYRWAEKGALQWAGVMYTAYEYNNNFQVETDYINIILVHGYTTDCITEWLIHLPVNWLTNLLIHPNSPNSMTDCVTEWLIYGTTNWLIDGLTHPACTFHLSTGQPFDEVDASEGCACRR